MARIAMRTLVLVAALAITVGVDAQQRQPRPAPPPPVAPPHATPPHATPPPVTMPFPPLAAPPAGGLTPRVPFTTIPNPLTTRDLFRVRPNDRVYSRTNGFPLGGYGGYGAGAYVPGVPQIEPSDAGAAYDVATGMLRVVGTPSDAQVFVDGYYVGTVRDLDLRGLALPAGSHRLEIRAPDREPVLVDVHVAPHETVTYDYRPGADRLQSPAAAAPRPAPATGPTKLYVIPNCYAGNVPPRANRLPRGCDVKDVQVL